ncbi:MAG: 2-C-methyl-D-erythritol 4-phosphate cytidylyltransferase, partial [Dehalococcoidales bacterium]
MSKKNGAGAVIVAAGESKRMGGEDKLFVSIGGEPLLAQVIDAFDSCPAIEQIVVVIREEKLAEVRKMILGHDWYKTIDTCIGGERRQDSVKAGLDSLDKCEWVVIH